MKKPECRIICNQGKGTSNDLLYEVSKLLRKPEYLNLYEDFVRNTHHSDTCENILRISLNYVNFCFVYMNMNMKEDEEC